MQRLLTIHAISWSLLVIDMLLMFVFRIFFIWSWVNLILLSIPFLSGICITLVYHKQLTLSGKIYFRLYIIYPVLCGLLLYFRTVAVMIIALPFLYLLVATTATRFVKNGPYTARAVPTLMGPRRVGFYKKCYIVEKEGPIIKPNDSELAIIQQMQAINAVTQNDTAISVNATVNNSSTNFIFRK